MCKTSLVDVWNWQECSDCLVPGNDSTYAQCRGCCNQLTGPIGEPAYDDCRAHNNC